MADDTDTTTADTGESSDARLDALESRQDGMDSKLDRILELLPGSGPKTGASSSGGDGGSGTDAGTPDIQSQVRAEIAAAQQRQQDEARAKGDADWRTSVEERLEQLKPEKTPREPERGPMGRIRRAMYGRADS